MKKLFTFFATLLVASSMMANTKLSDIFDNISGEGTTMNVDFQVGTAFSDRYFVRPYFKDADGSTITIDSYWLDNTTGGYLDPLNRFILTLNSTLADGVYSLVIPADCVELDGGNNAETTFKVKAEGGIYSKASGITDINDIYNLNVGDEFTYPGKVTVVFVQGNNMIVTDGTRYLLVYGSTGKTYKAGDIIPAGWGGKYSRYGSVGQCATPIGFQDATTTGTLPEYQVVKTDDALLAGGYKTNNMYLSPVELKGVTIVASGKNYNVTDEKGTFLCYNQYAVTLPAIEAEKTYNVKGFASCYGTKSEVMIASIEEYTADSTDVTTNVDIDFSNAISEGKVVGKKGEMMIPTVDPAFELGYNGDSIGVLRVGNGAATVAIADAELAQAGQIVTISFDIWFGNLTTKYAGIDLLDAVGDTIAGFSYNVYDKVFSYDRFGMDANKIKGVGSGSKSNAEICVPSNKTTFTITLDYGTNKMKIVHEYNGIVQQTIEDVTMSNTNPLKTFVLQSNYSAFGSMRRCWFDNLKITTMTPAHQHTLTLVSDTVPATDEIAGHLAYWQCTGTEGDPGCMLYFADSLGTDTIGDATALAAWLAGEGMLPIAYNKEDRYVVVTTNDTMLVANTKYLSEVTNMTDSVNSLLLIFREGTASIHAGDTIAIAESELKSVEMKKGKELMPFGRGTAMRTGNVRVNWIQLWENGPKFAEYNVGAENNKAEDYGGYYCWGSSIDKDSNTSITIKSGTDTLSGNDDTATNLWGSAWRMPTQAELQALLANCDVEWTVVNGVNGRKFTGKGDYASNSVFLPAAGNYGLGFVDGQGDYGYYWSSTPDGSDSAYYLYFLSSDQDVYSFTRYVGHSVRAVLAEE